MKSAEVAEKGGKQIKRPPENLKPQGRVQYNNRHALDVYNAASRSPSTEVLDDQLSSGFHGCPLLLSVLGPLISRR
jgi:hypothetical protein